MLLLLPSLRSGRQCLRRVSSFAGMEGLQVAALAAQALTAAAALEATGTTHPAALLPSAFPPTARSAFCSATSSRTTLKAVAPFPVPRPRPSRHGAPDGPPDAGHPAPLFLTCHCPWCGPGEAGHAPVVGALEPSALCFEEGNPCTCARGAHGARARPRHPAHQPR